MMRKQQVQKSIGLSREKEDYNLSISVVRTMLSIISLHST